MIQTPFNLSRNNKRAVMLLFDVIAIIGSIFAAFSIRLGYFFYPTGDVMLFMIASPLIALPFFIRFGLYREVIRYVGFKALWHISQAATLYAIVWGLLSFMVALDGIPRAGYMV